MEVFTMKRADRLKVMQIVVNSLTIIDACTWLIPNLKVT